MNSSQEKENKNHEQKKFNLPKISHQFYSPLNDESTNEEKKECQQFHDDDKEREK
jgi:hypothetical protein